MQEKENKKQNKMETTDLNQIYQQAYSQLENGVWKAKNYASTDQLAMWCVRCIEQYYERKVITERMTSLQDISVILSDHKLSVILNETGQHSWIKAEDIIDYQDTDADINNLLTALELAIFRAECL